MLRRRRRRAAIVGAACLAGLMLGWLVFGSTVFAVEHIDVEGTQRVPASSVRAAVEFELGHPMALVSVRTAARRVAQLPLVHRVTIVRSWPATLVVRVSEREPVAAVPATGGGVDLVDADGVVVTTAAQPPAALPLLNVDVPTAGADALRAALQVYDGLPATLRSMVRQVGATSPDAVGLVLKDRSKVNWGSFGDEAHKAEALLAVHPAELPHPATIDVSSPDDPAITGATVS